MTDTANGAHFWEDKHKRVLQVTTYLADFAYILFPSWQSHENCNTDTLFFCLRQVPVQN
jgi:gentisate 1,2-dioxygenase